MSHSKGRESPLGAEREREFPATKVGTRAEPICHDMSVITITFIIIIITNINMRPRLEAGLSGS